MFHDVIEFFFPAPLPEDAECQRRIRLIVYTVFITTLFSFFYVITSWMADFYMAAWIMLGCTLAFAVILFLIKVGLNVFLGANLFGLIGVLSLIGCAYFGSGLHSPTLPWLSSTPIVILLLVGKKSGYFWVGVSALLVLVFALLSFHGYSFPKLYPTSKEPLFFFSCYFGLVLIIFVLSIVFENIRIRAHQEISRQKEAVEDALFRLETAQAQLIHSEKMAALGELTTGIAHEIQNPLNFVNNFSGLNIELVAELKAEVAVGNLDEVITLANTIQLNAEKIAQHGSRADAIVKSMIQHSRKSSGPNEPTDINGLVEEYFRLSYHSVKTKNKFLDTVLQTHFDPQAGKTNVIRQDIGRVLLNLFDNAFYAVQDKKKQYNNSYEPILQVITKKATGIVEIRIKDNGNGIPEKIRGKIFQPFFTTKPTGQGTGLGLSLSYDIIKAHRGEIKVESEEGQGSEFIIQLPIKEG